MGVLTYVLSCENCYEQNYVLSNTKIIFVKVLKVCCLTLVHYNEICADEKFAILDGRKFAP